MTILIKITIFDSTKIKAKNAQKWLRE